jgi:hypothetical protein
LEQAAEAYNAFIAEVVQPILDNSNLDGDKLEFAEVSRLIDDRHLRRRHVQLAVELLEANIEEYDSWGSNMQAPTQAPTTAPVVSTLLAAAIGYAFAGPVAALVAAAIGYYAAQRHAENNHREELRSVEAHNAAVPGWRQTVKDWRKSIDELRDVET